MKPGMHTKLLVTLLLIRYLYVCLKNLSRYISELI